MSEEKFRCHPSIIAEKAGGVITALFFIAITGLDDLKEIISGGMNKESLLISGMIVVALALVVIYNVIVWSKTFINIEENTIVIQRNTINSKINTFGIKNISNVNLEQNIFERIMGTYKVKIDTDSLSTANTTDIEIVLSKKDAYNFKNKVVTLMNNESNKLEKQSTSVEKENFLEDENIDYDIVYSVNDVLKHCFYNLSLGKLIINLLFIVFIIFISYKVESGGNLISIIILSVTYGIAIIKIFFGDLFKYYNFSIKRGEDKLYISYGLFRIKKFTVPINRINALNIKQPALARIFKRYQSDMVTIGVGDNEFEGSQILLSSNKEDFIRNMKILLPEINMEEDLNLERESKNHHIIKIFEIVMGTIFISLILYAIYKLEVNLPFFIFLGLDFIGFLILVIFYYMSYITRGLYMGEQNMAISWGIFAKKISIIKYEKIQYMNVRQTPLSTKLGLCRGEIYILASLGNSMRTTGHYNDNMFENLKSKIL